MTCLFDRNVYICNRHFINQQAFLFYEKISTLDLQCSTDPIVDSC